jgi:Zn-dependent protease with chaperone function
MTQMSELLRVLRLPSIPTLALYAATLVAEVPVILARMLITFALLAIFMLIEGKSPQSAESLTELALIPTAWSIFALITPFGGGWWWLNNMGGRPPSERERAAYHDAIQLLQAHATLPLRLPSLWFVIDEPQPDAAVCGNTLMLSRGLLENEHLPAVLAHELGHLATSDGKLTARSTGSSSTPSPR